VTGVEALGTPALESGEPVVVFGRKGAVQAHLVLQLQLAQSPALFYMGIILYLHTLTFWKIQMSIVHL
jgi:hypothetical protein